MIKQRKQIRYCTPFTAVRWANSSIETMPKIIRAPFTSIKQWKILPYWQAYNIVNMPPLIKGGKNDAIFKNDLLHVIAFESGQYNKADKYYTSVGNREAACYSAYLNVEDANDKAALDSLIARYGDLPVCGSVAVAKYRYLVNAEDISAKQRIEYIDDAVKRWGNMGRIKLSAQRT